MTDKEADALIDNYQVCKRFGIEIETGESWEEKCLNDLEKVESDLHQLDKGLDFLSMKIRAIERLAEIVTCDHQWEPSDDGSSICNNCGCRRWK